MKNIINKNIYNKNIYNKNISKKNKYIIILIVIIFLLLLLFYIFDIKNITVQMYLNKIHNNIKVLYQKYPYLINKKLNIKNENNIIVIEDLLNKDYFDFLKNQFNNKTFDSKDVILRKGSGYNFFDLHKSDEFNGLVELYYSNEILNILSNILKKPIQRTPLNDPNACSLLLYSNKGDYIDWHLDQSLYYGDRYVVLLTLVNENKTKNDLSENEFHYIHNNQNYKLKMKPNTLVIFKGSEIMHKSTAINDGEKRILLSMVFCDICQEKKNIVSFIYEKVKNNVVYK
jgi:hypothetical protein